MNHRHKDNFCHEAIFFPSGDFKRCCILPNCHSDGQVKTRENPRKEFLLRQRMQTHHSTNSFSGTGSAKECTQKHTEIEDGTKSKRRQPSIHLFPNAIR